MKNKGIILGLDCSTTSTGWCIFDDKGLAAYGVIKPDGEDWRERLTKQAPKLRSIIEKYKPNKIVMEDVPLNSQGGLKILVVLGAVQGLVLGVASSLSVPIKFVTPNEWRSNYLEVKENQGKKIKFTNVTFDKEQLEEIVEKAKAEVLASINIPQNEWGKWVISEVRCPNCLEYFNTDCYSMGELNKCPSCGAKMKGGAES